MQVRFFLRISLIQLSSASAKEWWATHQILDPLKRVRILLGQTQSCSPYPPCGRNWSHTLTALLGAVQPWQWYTHTTHTKNWTLTHAYLHTLWPCEGHCRTGQLTQTHTRNSLPCEEQCRSHTKVLTLNVSQDYSIAT